MPSKIEDYALIGDCETAALVNREGSIDWLCWPDFSSSACFASLLGSEENGFWKIAPMGEGWKSSRKYREHTLILETTFENAEGAVRMIDFMPIRERNSDVVRIVEGIRGKMDLCMMLSMRFDYGRTVPWVTAIEDGIRAVAGPNLAVLHASVPVHGENLKTVAEFTVSEGQQVWFTLTYGESFVADPEPIDAKQALEDTVDFWSRWIAQLTYKGRYGDVVERSLITLKAMTFRPTGGLVAAMTTSLPEAIGGPRNWDYRYCWLRDTTFTLLAMTTAGYFEEAAAWQDWLLRAIAGSPDQVQIMYGLKGERQLVEWEIDWLPGYENSKPVRVGNAASNQLQLDIYGEMLDTFFHALHGLGKHTEEDFQVLVLLLDHLEKIWQRPDEGIWETRGGGEQFTYSKMMAWVAFDRAILIAEKLGCDAPVKKWEELRDTIHEEICRKAFNKEKNAFVQFYGADQLDASVLLMPLVGFLPATDPRVRGTIEAIERELMPDGFVLRYDTSKVKDGLPPGEGVFLACSFWMVSCLKAIGRLQDAHTLFDRLLALSNDVGLLSEEYDVGRKRLVGNFPQAFSHISLVNAAFDLVGKDGARQRAHRRGGPVETKA
ncbi:MAG TPA: glycoside hydrolase family 15 protein [Acidobacteriaceae bacterium]|jgi:GH15 family glucan-1,4-alpha-glucosidase|nr:glycoside hydrolase family 15 protein [Acidobacteriaceae bacterium]